MRITKCRICDSLCANWSSTARCGSCTSSRTCDLKASWISFERLKEDQQRIEIEYQFSASLHEREFVLGSTLVVVCERGLDMCTKIRRGMRRTRQCRVLWCMATSMLLTELRTCRCVRPLRRRCVAKKGAQRHPLEKLPERGLRQGVAHPRVEPERGPKAGCNYSDVRVAPRKNEVKQQQDWRFVFVDRLETFQIIDCLDKLVSSREAPIGTCSPGAFASLRACLRSAMRCVCEVFRLGR